jgi:hypothetical protein
MLQLLAVVWVGSVARVAVGWTHREQFDAELVLAVALSLVLPFAMTRV